MAKQSGIHQIRGKIGEHSYYRQTGVSSGLIRRINQGLSERVKTAPEYENTRLNNAQFKIAAIAAGSMFSGVQPILRPTHRLFRTSRLAAEFYKLLQLGDMSWGARHFHPENRAGMCAAMHKFSKRKMADYATISVGSYNTTTEKLRVNFSFNSEAGTYLQTMGADIIRFKVYQLKYFEGLTFNRIGLLLPDTVVINTISELEYSFNPEEPSYSTFLDIDASGGGDYNPADQEFLPFVVVVALPIRQGAEEEQILQGECTFQILPDPTTYAAQP